MKTWIRKASAVAALGFSLAGGAASAQLQEGLVNVNVSDITVELADVLDVNVSQIPVIVQAPIGIAANVCNVNVAILAQAGAGGVCTAESTSTAFNKVVQRQLVVQ